MSRCNLKADRLQRLAVQEETKIIHKQGRLLKMQLLHLMQQGQLKTSIMVLVQRLRSVSKCKVLNKLRRVQPLRHLKRKSLLLAMIS
jgi:hypothetical protein